MVHGLYRFCNFGWQKSRIRRVVQSYPGCDNPSKAEPECNLSGCGVVEKRAQCPYRHRQVLSKSLEIIIVNHTRAHSSTVVVTLDVILDQVADLGDFTRDGLVFKRLWESML